MAIEKTIKKDVWKNIFRLIVPHKKKFLWVVTLGLLSTGASLVEPLIYREAINDVAALFSRQARGKATKDPTALTGRTYKPPSKASEQRSRRGCDSHYVCS